MKLVIASDIHGSAFFCKKLLDAFTKENANRLVLLGDILYHGPRNDLPEGYSPKEVIELLNPLKNKILCVRGNCDSEVDAMVLEFPIMCDYTALCYGEHTLFFTHGHIFSAQNPLPMAPGDALVSGHTHIPVFTEENGRYFLNPGSVSIPKQDSKNSYIVFEDGTFTWKDLDGNAYMSASL